MVIEKQKKQRNKEYVDKFSMSNILICSFSYVITKLPPVNICMIKLVNELDHKNQFHHQKYFLVLPHHQAK
jgi:hypothetical protein